MFNSPFDSESGNQLDPESVFVFVSDLFLSDYVGGAELTTQALIDNCNLKMDTIKSSDVTLKVLEEGIDKFWIFGNFSALNFKLIPSIIANLNYSILEYDFKYCQYRSPEKHKFATTQECDCHDNINGKEDTL